MRRGSSAWTLLLAGIVLVLAGWFVLSFLTEPSAVGRMRTAMIGIGVGSIVVGAAGGIAAMWMLIARRT